MVCLVKCTKCKIYHLMEQLQNRHEAKRFVRKLLSGLIKCRHCKSYKLNVVDRDALKEEWDIIEE